jgi:hypothetical protein
LAALWQLLLLCPPLFAKPPGFEWILQQVEWELEFRKDNPSADRALWTALDVVKRRLRAGRPAASGCRGRSSRTDRY